VDRLLAEGGTDNNRMLEALMDSRKTAPGKFLTQFFFNVV
jgi:hypothetical protein